MLSVRAMQFETIDPHRHRFSGMAVFDMNWVTACLALFKTYGVNIRMLSIRPDFRKPASKRRYFSVEFVWLNADKSEQAFFDALKAQLEHIAWE